MIDGFRIAHDDHPGPGGGGVVVALHGWPGDRHDFRDVITALDGRCRVIAPDLRGFGETTGPVGGEPALYAADGQARSVIGLIEELVDGPVVLAGYDVGSRVAQRIAVTRPDLVRALVIAPPLPGAGRRVLTPDSAPEFWYQSFHQLALIEKLLDGSVPAVRAYLQHFWTHWSGPSYTPDPAELDRLAEAYGRPGAFVASINWYRGGAGMLARSVAEQVPDNRLAVPTTVLWPEHDPLFPRAWSDRLDEFLADVELVGVDGVGHFVPLEAPDAFAAAIIERLGR